jgi:hypothetical protein
MAMDQQRFNTGIRYDEAKEKMPRNKPNMDRIEGQLKVTDADLAPWKALNEKFNVMVLVIDPCPDVYTNLPLLQRIANESGKLDVRIFFRDENKDLMAEFMNGPFESVPVIAFYDQSFNLRTVFIERPKSVTDLRAEKTKEIHAANPDFGPMGRAPAEMPEEIRTKYQAAINEMRGATSDYYLAESTREFREIAAELGRPASGEAKRRGNLIAAVA